ncbi:hypothetical protein [Thermococcus sp.]
MTEVRDSVEVALELDEKSVYSHIAHESAEDIIRIISSLDAERARLRGEVIYYKDDWDMLIRERIAKGKRHTAFDFYNPALLDIWEEKVKESKRVKRLGQIAVWSIIGVVAVTALLSVLSGIPFLLIGLALLPLILYIRERTKSRLDLIYYELTQFFIDELREIVHKHALNPEKYRFKLFSNDYFDVETRRMPSGIFAVVLGKSEE